MNYTDLKTELTTDPLVRGYSGMTAEQAATDLNSQYRQRNRTSMSGAEIWENTAASGYAALTDAKKAEWLSFCGIAEVDPFGPAEAFVTYIFGAGSATVVALAAARQESVSRAQEILGENVTVGDVEYARSI